MAASMWRRRYARRNEGWRRGMLPPRRGTQGRMAAGATGEQWAKAERARRASRRGRRRRAGSRAGASGARRRRRRGGVRRKVNDQACLCGRAVNKASRGVRANGRRSGQRPTSEERRGVGRCTADRTGSARRPLGLQGQARPATPTTCSPRAERALGRRGAAEEQRTARQERGNSRGEGWWRDQRARTGEKTATRTR